MIIHNPILTGSLVFNGTNLTTSNLVTTGSNNFTGSQSISGSLNVTGNITAQTLVVQTVSSSVIYSSGSNVFGNNIANTQTFTGSVNITGSVTARGQGTFTTATTIPLIAETTGGNSGLMIKTSSSTTNWLVGGQYNVIDGFEITPSTAAGGTTFSTPALVIKNTGNVGIGTNNPISPIHIYSSNQSMASNLSSSYSNSKFRLEPYNSSGVGISMGLISPNVNYLQSVYSDGATTAPFVINPYGGNVGIGTSSPGLTLEVNGGGRFTSNLAVGANLPAATYPLNTSSGAGTQILSDSTRTGGGGWILRNNGVDSIYLGTANWTGVSGFGTGAADIALSAAANSAAIVFATGTSVTERARITSGGFFKATSNGTYGSGPAYTVHEFNQSTSGYQTINFNHIGSNPYGPEINFGAADPNNATNYVLGCYTSSPSFVWIYRIWSNGTVSARSDARWKKNIESTRDGYLDDLCRLRVVKYNWYNNEEGAPKELGLIAQEVEEVFPNLIQYDKVTTKKQVEQEDGTFIEQEVEDGESRSVKVSVLPFMLLKALQEANAKIEELSSKINALENK